MYDKQINNLSVAIRWDTEITVYFSFLCEHDKLCSRYDTSYTKIHSNDCEHTIRSLFQGIKIFRKSVAFWLRVYCFDKPKYATLVYK